MTKVDQLIEKFKEFKEELNKNMNGSYAPGANMKPTATTGTSGGQTGMYRSEDMEKQTMNPSAGGAQDMMMVKFEKNGQWKMVKADESYLSQDGKNREANPKLRASDLGPGGKIHHIKKDEGTNEEANPTQPHNKEKFKVMPMASEKESKKESVSGKPYNGKDKDIKKGDHGKLAQGNEAKGFDENKAPGRGTLTV